MENGKSSITKKKTIKNIIIIITIIITRTFPQDNLSVLIKRTVIKRVLLVTYPALWTDVILCEVRLTGVQLSDLQSQLSVYYNYYCYVFLLLQFVLSRAPRSDQFPWEWLGGIIISFVDSTFSTIWTVARSLIFWSSSILMFPGIFFHVLSKALFN